MKKLIPMMVAAACTFSVFAEGGLLKTEGFEKLTAGDKLTLGSAWTCEDGNDGLTVTAYDKSAKYEYTEGDKLLGEDAPGNNNLAIDNTKPLYNNVNGSDGQSIASDDLYIDTLVKFTVTDSDTTPEADTNAKLAIWLQDAGTTTNLMLRCGALDGSKVLSSQDIALNAGTVEADAWHRLTVRAVKSSEVDQLGTAISVFEVFLDGKKDKLADAEGNTSFLACVAGTTITGVGFKGNGSIDDVAFADAENAPSFAVPPVTKLTITWNKEIVTALDINGEAADAESGSAEVEPVDGVVTVSGIVCSGDYVAVDQEFTAESESFEVAYVTAGVVADGKKYATLQDALADGASAITLKAAATIADLENYIEVGGEEAVDMSIDLAGNTITATDLAVPVLFYVIEGSTLSIVDSVGGGVITVSAAADNVEFAGLVMDDGAVTIGSATDKGVTVDGMLTAGGSNTTLNSGKFLASANEGLADVVTIPEDYELAEDGDYLVVQEKGEPEPEPTALTSIELSATTVEYGTAVAPTATVKAGEDVVDAENYDISYSETLTATTPAGTVIDVTATAKGDDYTGEVKANFTVVAKAVEPTVTLSETTAEFSDTLELPTVTVEGYTLDTDYDVAWDQDLPKENPAEAVELTVTVTMKGNYTGSNTATFTVTPKKGGDPIPGEDVVPEDQKTAYDEWAAKTGVTTSTDKALGANLATAFLLGVEGTATPEAAIDAGKLKVAAYEKDIDFAALAAEGPEAALENLKLPAGLAATLVPVEKTEIDTTASLFRLAIQPAK